MADIREERHKRRTEPPPSPPTPPTQPKNKWWMIGLTIAVVCLFIAVAVVATVLAVKPTPNPPTVPTIVQPSPPPPPRVKPSPSPVWVDRETMASVLRQTFPNAVIHLQGEGYVLPAYGKAYYSRYAWAADLVIQPDLRVGITKQIDARAIKFVEFLQPR